MKVPYEKEVSAIKDWIQRTNAQLSTGALPAFAQIDCWKIRNDLQAISTNIQYEYGEYECPGNPGTGVGTAAEDSG